MNDTATSNLKWKYNMQNWTKEDIQHDLPRIKKLKGIEDAWINGWDDW